MFRILSLIQPLGYASHVTNRGRGIRASAYFGVAGLTWLDMSGGRRCRTICMLGSDSNRNAPHQIFSTCAERAAETPRRGGSEGECQCIKAQAMKKATTREKTTALFYIVRAKTSTPVIINSSMWQLQLLRDVIPAFEVLARQHLRECDIDAQRERKQDLTSCYADMMSIRKAMQSSGGEWTPRLDRAVLTKLLEVLESRFRSRSRLEILLLRATSRKERSISRRKVSRQFAIHEACSDIARPQLAHRSGMPLLTSRRRHQRHGRLLLAPLRPITQGICSRPCASFKNSSR